MLVRQVWLFDVLLLLLLNPEGFLLSGEQNQARFLVAVDSNIGEHRWTFVACKASHDSSL